MPSLSDKELDRLSREAAENYEVEQHFGAWNRLEELLNKELGKPSTPIPKVAKPGTTLFYVPAAILLVGLATYLITKSVKHNSNSTLKNQSAISSNSNVDRASVEQKNAEKKTAAKIDAVPKQKPADANDVKNRNDLNNTQNDVTADNSVIEKNRNTIVDSKAAANSFSKQIKKNVEKENSDNDENENAIISAEKKVVKNKNSSSKNLGSSYKTNGKNSGKKDLSIATNQKENSAGNTTETTKKQNASWQKNTSPVNSDELNTVTVSGLHPIAHNKITINDASLKNAKKQSLIAKQDVVTPGKSKHSKSLFTNRSLEIGFVLSPDFSKVRYDYNNRVGSNFGFTIDYQISPKFSVNSGFIFTTKNYAAEGHDFHLPQNCGIDQDDLDFAFAHVHMYEIPLNLRFDFNKTGNTSFFVNAGASSYITSKQDFKFYLHSNNVNPLGFSRWQYNTYNNKQSYLFSALNLSFGFESRLSNVISLQVEPYMKLPLSGVGFGNVNLSSYGINTAIKFAPLLKRSRK
ncbi:MAG: outer membrane beta-barrel protein [Bacteroidetes bacterium]|nr:outer membrane beta-barrel protein [Bacteroidota bacterium]